MASLLVFAGWSFATALTLTPLARSLGKRYGLVDHPDGCRKAHATSIPVVGGISILLSISPVAGAALLRLASDDFADHGTSYSALLLAALAICLIGVADDYRCLRGRHKLFGQLVAVTILVQSGLVVRHVCLFGYTLDLGLLAVPLTVCWLLGAINAFNLLDGMDGVSSCVALIISVGVVAMAVLHGQWWTACLAAALAGSLMGFLPYNLPPASVFLGDSGSMLVGLIIGVTTLQAASIAPATIGLVAPMALLAIPFFDTVAAIARRTLTGRSIYMADRGHLHHCLQRRGFSDWTALICICGCCTLTAAGAVAGLWVTTEPLGLLVVALVIGVLVATGIFGYAELLLVKKRLVGIVASFFWLPSKRRPRHLEVHLQGSANWAEIWSTLVRDAPQLNVVMMRLNINAPGVHEHYHARWDRTHEVESSQVWRTELPLVVNGQHWGQLEFRGLQDDEPISVKILGVAKAIESLETLAWTLAVQADGSVAGVEMNSRPRVLKPLPSPDDNAVIT
jgi:UDP-GlcNAc:undecaprenyl-phosphate GlcNAc-1-phosphate transferase